MNKEVLPNKTKIADTTTSKKIIIGLFLTVGFMAGQDIFSDFYDLKFRSPVTIERRKQNVVMVEDRTTLGETKNLVESNFEGDISAEQKQIQEWIGTASWYGTAPGECVGCSETLTMANGQRLDDTRLTIAFNKLPLGSVVTVINLENGQQVTAEVTDTGGFEKLGRIADLSKAVKNSISCNDLCEVKITYEE